MNKFKGTKGKWSNFAFFDGFYSVESDVGYIICNTIDKEFIDLQNAKLIAAAPELLDAAQRVLNNELNSHIKLQNAIKKATE